MHIGRPLFSVRHDLGVTGNQVPSPQSRPLARRLRILDDELNHGERARKALDRSAQHRRVLLAPKACPSASLSKYFTFIFTFSSVRGSRV